MTKQEEPAAPLEGCLAPPDPESDWGYFLDFDGTLVEIADTPSSVAVDGALVDLLGGILRATDGAVVIVTGRPLQEIDGFLAPLLLPVAAQHGGERRFADGRIEHLAGGSVLRPVGEAIRAFCQAHPGTLMEEKGTSVTLHYRGAPQAEGEAKGLMESLCAGLGDTYRLLVGKMVLEIKPADVDKGRAVAAFLSEPAFKDRRPVAVGDDRTDEDAFRAVNAVGGISVRVGTDIEGSVARYGLPDPPAVRAWLAQILCVGA